MFRKISLFCVALLAATAAFGQSAIQRAETQPGVYDNVSSYNTGPTVWLASGARTATQTLADQTNVKNKGIIASCNVTAAPGVETLTLSLQMKEPAGGSYSTVAANTATTATGAINVKLYPGITPVAASVTGQSVADIMFNTWRLVMTHSAASSWTYSCSYQLLN